MTRPEEQNDQLLRLISANKVRLAKLQQTIADLQERTDNAGKAAHLWEKRPTQPHTLVPALRKPQDSK